MLGIHVKKTSSALGPPHRERKTLANAIQVDCSILGLDAAQIFTHGPRNHVKNLNQQDIVDIKALSGTISISVHSSYPTVAIWNLTHANKDTPASKRIIGHIRDQLKCCAEIDARGLVIHISRKRPSVIVEAMEICAPIAKKIGVPIWLEMISSKAHEDLTYETPEKLNRLVDCLKHIDPAVWGLCVDTAHVWGSGTDISDRDQMDAWMSDLTDATRAKISIMHLNGSSSAFGSGSDKHEVAFCSADLIYGKNLKSPHLSGVKSIIDYCTPNRIPVILEINRGAESDVIDCIDIIAAMEQVPQ